MASPRNCSLSTQSLLFCLVASCLVPRSGSFLRQQNARTTTIRPIKYGLMMASPFDKACLAFEKAHQEDPRTTDNDNERIPYSVHYHRRMVHWLDQLSQLSDKDKDANTDADADASEAVQLAARCQHIRRWTSPRADYPKGLKGYQEWRTNLKDFHAQEAAAILMASGYAADMTDRVGQLLRKEHLESDPEVQLLEDVICVVFLENEYTAFIEQDEYASADKEDKLVRIVQKTWNKMTPRGHKAALQLAGSLSDRGLRVVEQALANVEEEEA